MVRLRWGLFGVGTADGGGGCGGEVKVELDEYMIQARALVIKLYYSSWKGVVFVPAKGQSSELVFCLLEALRSSEKIW